MPVFPISNEMNDYLAGVMHAGSCGDRPSDRIPDTLPVDPAVSAVLFLLAPGRSETNAGPCLVLNKRSQRVRQPGDLCCPGGSVSPRLDRLLAAGLTVPGAPLARWPYWRVWQKRHPERTGALSLLLATALRESLEEMRLNPLGVQFIGPLPPRSLAMFRRDIYPLAAWIPHQRRFFPNWEVERIVRIPLQHLLDPERYARYRIRFASGMRNRPGPQVMDFPCFIHDTGDRRDILWGATFRIVQAFLEEMFRFRTPDAETLSVVTGHLDDRYTAGSR